MNHNAHLVIKSKEQKKRNGIKNMLHVKEEELLNIIGLKIIS